MTSSTITDKNISANKFIRTHIRSSKICRNKLFIVLSLHNSHAKNRDDRNAIINETLFLKI